MKEKEEIKVYINIIRGETVCLCSQKNKMCSKKCEKDVVIRDKFKDWEQTFHRNKYGK